MAQEAERFPAPFKKALIRAMGRLQGPLRPLINKTMDREREASIVLAPELRDRIIEVYGSSNRRLEKQIGIPLDKYGY